MAYVNQARQANKTGGPGAHGPALTFTGSIAIALLVLAVAGTVMARDFALATVATVFFVLTAIVALLAWQVGTKPAKNALNYWDVAGVLLLFGIGAAAFLDSDALIRLIEGRRAS
jgi:putative Mn2+ efflux pump MntP